VRPRIAAPPRIIWLKVGVVRSNRHHSREDHLRTRLIEWRELAPEVRHFAFEVPELEHLHFTPGQFVSFTEILDGLKVTRAYSIASPPDGNRFELCLNRVEEGRFSPYLFRMQPGDEIEMKGPLGGFVLRDPAVDAVFVATGTGVAPIRSILLHELQRGTQRQYTFLFGVRQEGTLLYGEEFNALAARHPNFHFLPTLTRGSEDWKGLRGRVQQHLASVIGDRRDLHVYICGMKAMVEDVRTQLKEWGFDRKQIIYEKYD
jgi:ferredoxin-NADP reductase